MDQHWMARLGRLGSGHSVSSLLPLGLRINGHGAGLRGIGSCQTGCSTGMLLSTLPRRLSAVQSNITTKCVPHGTSCLCKAVFGLLLGTPPKGSSSTTRHVAVAFSLPHNSSHLAVRDDSHCRPAKVELGCWQCLGQAVCSHVVSPNVLECHVLLCHALTCKVVDHVYVLGPH